LGLPPLGLPTGWTPTGLTRCPGRHAGPSSGPAGRPASPRKHVHQTGWSSGSSLARWGPGTCTAGI